MQTALEVAYEVIIPILLVAGFGFWFGRAKKPDPGTLSRIAIYLFSPALVFRSSATSTLQAGEIGQIVACVSLIFVVIAVLSFVLARLQRGAEPALQSAFVLSVLLSNSGNYGLSFVEFAFGQQALQIGVLVVVINSIMSNTLGIYVASSGTASVKQGIINIFKVPVIYATLLGFIINFAHIQLPVPLMRSVDVLSQAAVPIMTVLLGVQLARISLRGDVSRFAGALTAATVARLLVTPVIILLLVAVTGITGLTRDVLLVQLSTPTAVYATLLATEFGSDAQFVTASVLVTTLASLVTLSLIMALFVA